MTGYFEDAGCEPTIEKWNEGDKWEGVIIGPFKARLVNLYGEWTMRLENFAQYDSNRTLL